tara:strand:+ start:8373 stop:8945 length:573 start_codon:yes stop_codon:yes gene_type:complete
MSASQAASRAKARRGASSTTSSDFEKQISRENNKPPVNIQELIVNHDYKLFIFEQKIKELYELFNKNNRQDNNDSVLNTIDENMLSQALSSMDQRLDSFENNLNEINNSKNNTDNDLQLTKLDNEQKDLKTLLLKIQGTVMETQMQMMQLKGANNSTLTNQKEVKEDEELKDITELNGEDIGKKKNKKSN